MVTRLISEADQNASKELVAKADAQYQSGDYDAAIRNLNEATNRNPNNADAFSGLGRVYNTLEKYEEAMGYLQKALNLQSEHQEALYNSGVARMGLKQFRDAGLNFSKLTSVNPKHTEGWNKLGEVNYAQEKNEEAISYFEQSLACSKGQYADAHKNIGFVRHKMKQYSDAIQAFGQAIAINKNDADAWYHSGRTKAVVRDFEGAINDLEEANRLDPDNKKIIANLAGVRAEWDARTAINQRLQSIDSDTEYLKSQVERYEEEHKREKRIIKLWMTTLFFINIASIYFLAASGVIAFESDGSNPLAFMPWFVTIALINFPMVWEIRLIIQRANKAELMAAEYAHLRYIENQIFAYSVTSGNNDGIKIRADYIMAMMSKSPSDKLLAMNRGKSSTEANQTPHEVIIKEIHKNLSGGNK